MKLEDDRVLQRRRATNGTQISGGGGNSGGQTVENDGDKVVDFAGFVLEVGGGREGGARSDLKGGGRRFDWGWGRRLWWPVAAAAEERRGEPLSPSIGGGGGCSSVTIRGR